MFCLAMIGGNQWHLNIADVESAFLQVPELKRPGGPIYVRPPVEGTTGDCDDLYECCKPVYGLDDAPMKFCRHFGTNSRKC